MIRTLCNEINAKFEEKIISVSGWFRTKRNHGNVLFVDLYDASGMIQCVIEKENAYFNELSKLNVESVVKFIGKIKKRSKETINTKIPSGEVELIIENVEILSKACELPFSLTQQNIGEEMELKYRYLYLRTPEMQKILKLRTEIIDMMRTIMKNFDFQEIQTPLLSSSSPEGARDYLVPSRLHKGKFYALPQAPQQFKQLLMASGVEKYFQVAPCFRDEDSRADRLLGEFYQLDFEMAYATQEDILNILENLMTKLFTHFGHKVTKFVRLSYKEAITKYGSDKPDLRNPLQLVDITEWGSSPEIFKKLVSEGGKLLTISCEFVEKPEIERITKILQENKAPGLAYTTYKDEWKGPLAKMLSPETIKKLTENGQKSIFLIASNKENVYKLGGILRTELAKTLKLINNEEYKFCFITDFPMFEKQDDKWEFCHNPFSMPQNLDLPLEEILSFQYDLVCNGYEITSGAVRNHDIEKIHKVFALIDQDYDLETRFPLFKSFKYGIPPHAGAAPGIDRIVMLLSKKKNVRDIVAFPLNQSGVHLLMEAPSEIEEKTLKELGIKVIK